MKKIIDKFKKLSLAVKLQLLTALICTAAIPVYAWFAYQDRIEAFTRVKEPPSINLASGGDDSALYITLENIDVNSEGHEKWVVFSVEPGKYPAYDIQLSHTTNIPFTYQLYRVSETENGAIKYIDHTRVSGEETELKYDVMTSAAGSTEGMVALQDINSDDGHTGRTLGDETKLVPLDRVNYAQTDKVNQYVRPLYSVARNIPQLNVNEDGSSGRDYFAIKITWEIDQDVNTDVNNANYWNYAFNNKETDIIYISAKQNTASEA